ncbi:sensor histidine kinase [Mahella australiensis]|nr:histidine kinase [Mahella australiensis]
MQSKIGFYLNTLENNIDNIKRFQKEIADNKDLEKLSSGKIYMDSFERNEAILHIQSELVRLKRLTDYVEEANVYIPIINKKISTSSVSIMPKYEAEGLARLDRNDIHPFMRLNKKFYISTVVYYTRNSAKIPKYIISIRISTAMLSDTLKQFLTYERGGAILLTRGRGIEVTDGTPRYIVNSLRHFFIKEDINNVMEDVKFLTIDGQNYSIIYKKSDSLDTALIAYIPESDMFGSLEKYNKWFWFVSALTACMIIAFSYGLRYMIVQPLSRLIGAFEDMDRNNVNVAVSYEPQDELSYLYARFNEMIKKMQDLIQQAYEEKLRAQHAELKQLQYQINPHFLYNSFFLIYRMAKMNDCDGIMLLTQHLANFYRFITRASNDEVTLQDEMDHVKNYVAIQSIRFGERIKVEITDLPLQCQDLEIPRLTIQPLVENAYTHGLKNKIDGGIIKINVESTSNEVIISVEDNGDEVTDSMIEELSKMLASDDVDKSTGMFNVHRRLKLKYGSNSGIEVLRGKMGGMCVRAHIRYEEGDRSD